MTKGFRPEIVVLFCRQSVSPAVEVEKARALAKQADVRLVAMPCSGKVEVPHLMKVLAQGADGVLVAACPEKQCRHLVGNRRAERRISRAQALLEEAGVGAARVSMKRGQDLDAEKLAAFADEQAEAVGPLGANPVKGEKQ